MTDVRELGRAEYAEKISLLGDDEVLQQLSKVDHEVEVLQYEIMHKYGGLRELASAAKGWPSALDLQRRYKAAALRRVELRRRAGRA